MGANAVGDDDDVIWMIRPWIIPSLAEETVMAVIVFVASLLAEIYFGSVYAPIFGTNLVTLTGLGLLLIWVINAFHLILVRSTSRYTLRRSGLEVRTGILNRNTVLVYPSNFSAVDVMQSGLGKVMGSGEMFVRIRGDHGGEGKMRRVRNPFVLEKDVKRIMSTL
jgi:membrane protein YdbS with pleckstrin-like domain